MKCPKCGSENAESAKFCKRCGEKLGTETVSQPKENSNRNLIIAAVIAVVIILAGVGVYASGILNPGVPLETKDFEVFKMDVPVGSNFVVGDQYTSDEDNLGIVYDNHGKYSDEAYCFFVGNSISEDMVLPEAEVIEDTGTMKVYEIRNETTTYEVLSEYDESQVLLIGGDVDTLKRMAESYEEGDISKLANDMSEPTDLTGSSSSSSMSILGGSFETGGGLEDKTYASIYVGPEHSGESVTIQIFYSRDGATLNNGNMVPKTVDSSGYIHVRSADAYEYFPDHADINLYDSSGNLVDSHSVNLSPSSGTQTF